MRTRIFYFDDYEVGEEGFTSTRTINASDIVNFAGYTMDYAAVHVDRCSSTAKRYGERICRGLLGASLAVGLISYWSPKLVGEHACDGYLSSIQVDYHDAIKVGDTIRIRWRIEDKFNDPIQKKVGVVKTSFKIENQEMKYPYSGVIFAKVRKEGTADTTLQLSPGVLWDIKPFIQDPTKFRYLDDFVPGEGAETGGRTITESDIVNFVGLTEEYNSLYIDAEHAKGSKYGERIAPLMLITSFTLGLWCRDHPWLPVWWPTLGELKDATHRYDKTKFFYPVKIGDTIRCRYKTLETRVSKSRPDRGLLTLAYQTVNQRNEVVAELESLFGRPLRSPCPH